MGPQLAAGRLSGQKRPVSESGTSISLALENPTPIGVETKVARMERQRGEAGRDCEPWAAGEGCWGKEEESGKTGWPKGKGAVYFEWPAGRVSPD